MRKILIFVYALLIAIASTFVQFQDVHAMDEADDSSFVILDENGNPVLDEDGNETYRDKLTIQINGKDISHLPNSTIPVSSLTKNLGLNAACAAE